MRAWRTRLGLNALELACWDAWESLGIMEIARTIKDRFLIEGSAARLSLMFCSCIQSRSMLPVSYYLLIPSHPRPLMGDPLDLSVLKQDLGVPKAPSYVFCLFGPTSIFSSSVFSL